jgi:hypothetical protein
MEEGRSVLTVPGVTGVKILVKEVIKNEFVEPYDMWRVTDESRAVGARQGDIDMLRGFDYNQVCFFIYI